MAEITIPESHKKGLVTLLRLSEESFNKVITAFEGVAPKFYPEELSNEVISHLTGVSSDDVLEIVATLLSLSRHRVHDEATPEELADQVLSAALENGIEQFSIEDQKLFKQRLVQFFKIESLLISAKAVGLLQSHENLFCSARILTDIRPVFGSDPMVTPAAAVMVHMLDLGYHHDGDLKHIYIAMDNVDIELLREALDRAELKSESVKTLIRRTGSALLDPSE